MANEAFLEYLSHAFTYETLPNSSNPVSSIEMQNAWQRQQRFNTALFGPYLEDATIQFGGGRAAIGPAPSGFAYAAKTYGLGRALEIFGYPRSPQEFLDEVTGVDPLIEQTGYESRVIQPGEDYRQVVYPRLGQLSVFYGGNVGQAQLQPGESFLDAATRFFGAPGVGPSVSYASAPTESTPVAGMQVVQVIGGEPVPGYIERTPPPNSDGGGQKTSALNRPIAALVGLGLAAYVFLRRRL